MGEYVNVTNVGLQPYGRCERDNIMDDSAEAEESEY